MSERTATTGANGRQTITTTGTGVALPSANGAKAILICALQSISTLSSSANSETILKGIGEAPTWGASYTGIPLAQGECMTITIDETNDIYINGVAGDGVSYTYIY